jgi:GntR family transcriptional regulator
MQISLLLDFRSGIPIYVQIMDQIKNLIVSGDLKPGDQLPTVRQLASDLRVNFNTVARAYRMLDNAGLISTQHGRGTYILSAPEPGAAEQLKRQTLQALTRSYLVQAQHLGVSPVELRDIFEQTIGRWEQEGVIPDTVE